MLVILYSQFRCIWNIVHSNTHIIYTIEPITLNVRVWICCTLIYFKELLMKSGYTSLYFKYTLDVFRCIPNIPIWLTLRYFLYILQCILDILNYPDIVHHSDFYSGFNPFYFKRPPIYVRYTILSLWVWCNPLYVIVFLMYSGVLRCTPIFFIRIILMYYKLLLLSVIYINIWSGEIFLATFWKW